MPIINLDSLDPESFAPESFDVKEIIGSGTMTVSQSLGDADTKWILDFSPMGGLNNIIGGIVGGGSGEEEENE